MTTSIEAGPQPASEIDSSYAWMRLAVALALSTIGSVGMWSFVVALPAVQADFGIARGEASLPFTLTMFGFGIGGIVMGRLADRFGIVMPVHARRRRARRRLRALGHRRRHRHFALAQGLLGFSAASATFGPLMTDMSHWFVRRRGIAVAIASSGNYLAGTIWPPIIQHFIDTDGWRPTQIGIGVFCIVTLLPLSLLLRRRAPTQHSRRAPARMRRASVGDARYLAERADGAAVHRRHRLLCRDVDAAGPYRRLLRRSRLRAGARRRDAVDDAGLRADQPHRLRLHRRSHRRPGDAFAELGAAGRRAASVTCSSMVYFLSM